MRASGAGGTAGFTLVELMIVAALIAPLLLVVGVTSRAVFGSVETNTRAAETTELAVRSLAELGQVLRFGRVSTVRVIATKADVDAGRAAKVGDWCSPPQLDPRSEIELRALVGERDLALEIPSRLYRLAFVREAGELANGSDDDGDGLVDEGELQLTVDGRKRRVLDRLEQCSFEIDGNVILVTLSRGVPVHAGILRRTTTRHAVFLLNR